ncbi:hypothetical protein [Demequina activiva]|uniref:Uncharacterized protein n=1 Tax=Demequina activiva TaxID=1582364 RepID=A0A919Q174_9MICO|nr:hypothetical protein [Demequina activiva]GIG53759.1 hypothetical protein Dac01nite_05110 [Demequina activiva]
MHSTTGAQPYEPVGAAWRQQALRVVHRAPEAALSTLPTGHAALLPGRTFAQHGLLGEPDALVVAFAVENRGRGVAPLAELSVSFSVPGVLFAEDGSVQAGWQEGEEGWSATAGRIGDEAQVGLSHRGTVLDGATVGGAFRILLRPDADLSRTRIEVTATGFAQIPERPVMPSALAVAVDRLEF